MKMTQAQAFALLEARLLHARKEHPVFARTEWQAMDVISEEVQEFYDAVDGDEGPARCLDEALDSAAVFMRYIMGEVKA